MTSIQAVKILSDEFPDCAFSVEESAWAHPSGLKTFTRSVFIVRLEPVEVITTTASRIDTLVSKARVILRPLEVVQLPVPTKRLR